MQNKGFLMVTMEPPPAIEEEFNDWYDTEHVPERIAIDGFETAQRYVCVNGFPRYMAAYDLSHPGVIDETPYQSISGDKFTPWSRRILRKVRGLWRVTGEQIYPGDARVSQAPRLLLLHYCGVREASVARLIEQLRATYEAHGQVRVIRYAPAPGEAAAYVALVAGKGNLGALQGPALEGEFGDCIVAVNEYARYWAYAPNAALGKVVDG